MMFHSPTPKDPFPPADEPKGDAPQELNRIAAWRVAQLLENGYDPRTAEKIAWRTDIDLHKACDMVRQGCEPELAARILV